MMTSSVFCCHISKLEANGTRANGNGKTPDSTLSEHIARTVEYQICESLDMEDRCGSCFHIYLEFPTINDRAGFFGDKHRSTQRQVSPFHVLGSFLHEPAVLVFYEKR